VAHFAFCLGSSCVLCFHDCDGAFSVRFALYSFLCNMFFIMCISVCFAFVVIGYVRTQFNRKLIPESLCSWGVTCALKYNDVCVGFLYIENSNLSFFQCVVMSK
jgi:hypothetical protein